MSKEVVVIGGGPAGMMAAIKASEYGNNVVLVEKNNKLGRKLYISGKGRCNLTNYADVKTLIENTPGNGNFLYSTYNNCSSYDIMSFFDNNGVPTKVERGNRVFPVSDKAADVIDCLYSYLKKCDVEIKFNSTVKKVLIDNNIVTGVLYEDTQGTSHKILCDAVIVATGGVSYPGTGSTGDGYKFAQNAGHTIVDPKPSLIPFITAEPWVKDLQGLSLRNVEIKLKNKDKTLHQDFGEMLFTHYGVSGPLILSASRHIPNFDYKDIKLYIDLKPALNEEVLDDRIKRDFEKYDKKNFNNSLNDLLPQKLIPVVVMLSNIPEDKQVNQITKEERLNLVHLLKNFVVTPIKPRPIKEAIVTAGGVNIKEVNPSTMESKIVGGLYFSGEVLDVDAYTGGFNLTIAFSTGYTAGISV